MSEKSYHYQGFAGNQEEDLLYSLINSRDLSTDERRLLNYCYALSDKGTQPVQLHREELEQLLRASIVDVVIANLIMKGIIYVYQSEKFMLINFDLE